MFRRFGQLFSKKLRKVPHFAKKREKSSIWAKVLTFSSKLPCFGVSVISLRQLFSLNSNFQTVLLDSFNLIMGASVDF